MKFIYKGHAPIKDVDLTIAGIFKPEDVIVNGTVFEIPDENKLLIQRVEVQGIYELYSESKKVKIPKKDKAELKEEKVEEEK